MRVPAGSAPRDGEPPEVIARLGLRLSSYKTKII